VADRHLGHWGWRAGAVLGGLGLFAHRLQPCFARPQAARFATFAAA